MEPTDFYRINRDLFDLLNYLGFNSVGLLTIVFLMSFVCSVFLLVPLKKSYFEKGKMNLLPAILSQIIFAIFAYIICPLAFLSLVFFITEHVVGMILGTGIYIGILKLIYVISEYLGYKLSNIEEA